METQAPTTAARSASSTEGYWFDEKAADLAVGFFPKYLRHTEGEWAGRPFRLQPWQAKAVREAFGWKRRDGSRRYRQVYLEVPRKNGKTELAAGIALLGLLADGEKGGQGYALAVDKDQATICFRKAGQMVAMSEALSEACQVFKTAIFCPELMASFKPLSSAAATKHGLSASLVIGDELHEWPDDELYDVVHKSTGARRQPLEWYITTAGRRGYGFGWQMHQYARQVLEGEIQDPAFLPVIYAAAEEDDWTDPKVWAKANPNLGVSLKLEYLAAECAKAQQSPRLENAFRRFHLNQWTEQATRWLPLAQWDQNTGDPADRGAWKRYLEADALRGQVAFGAIDLAATSDINALCWHLPVATPRPRQLWRFWLPEGSLAKMDERRRQMLLAWKHAGALTLTPGNVADYDFIVAQVKADAALLDVKQIGIDKWNATQVALQMQGEGLPVEFFRQNFGSFAAPSMEFERLVMNATLEHGNHPVARWMVGNAAVITDANGNIRPAKHQAADKIDGVVASIMALGLAMATPQLKSVYEQRGVLVL